MQMKKTATAAVFSAALAVGLGFQSNEAAAQAATCENALAEISKVLQLNQKFANAHDVGVACSKASNKPAVATRNFLDRFVKTYKIEEKGPAEAAAASRCPVALRSVARILHINAKFANDKDIGVACNKAKGRGALASRNFLDRFVKNVLKLKS